MTNPNQTLEETCRRAGWTGIYETGVLEIDRQHMRLFLMIRDLDMGNTDIKTALNAIAEYAKLHFTLEEELMRECGYAEGAAHAQLHRDFEREVERFVSDPPERLELAKFLKQWLLNHILKGDKEFGHFTRTRANTRDTVRDWEKRAGAATAEHAKKGGGWLGKLFSFFGG